MNEMKRFLSALAAAALLAACASPEGREISTTGTTTTGAGGAGGASGTGGAKASAGVGGAACPLYVVPAGTDLTTPIVSLKTDVMPLLNASCGATTCHGTTMSPTGALFLGVFTAHGSDAAKVYKGLVGVKGNELTSMPLVTAGDPSKSYLMHKADDDQCHFDAECLGGSCLAAMPNGGQIMPVESRDTLRRWIAQGAKDN